MGRTGQLSIDRAGRSATDRVIAIYYALTLVFVLCDFAFDFNVRLSFLQPWPQWRVLYYLIAAACFILIMRFPNWSNVVAAGESLINLSALIVSMGLKVLLVDDAMLDGGRGGLSLAELLNFALSGSVGYLALSVNSRAAHRDLSR